MKKQSIGALAAILIFAMTLSGCGGGGSTAIGDTPSTENMATENTATENAPTENEYDTLYSELLSEESYLDQLIAEAEDKLNNTPESSVADASVLASLSDMIETASEYEKYPVPSGDGEKGDAELTNLRAAYDTVREIEESLSTAIGDVDESVAEMERIEEEKADALVWPGTTYTYETTDANGFTVEVKLRFGSWIRANDKENLNRSWKKAGGKGDAPDISTFTINRYKFRDDTSAMAFATMEVTNKTDGYDFTEEYPYTPFLYIDMGKKLPYGTTLAILGKIYYSSSVGILAGSASPKMTSNHWGPVMIAFAAGNVFGPKYDENGDPDLDKLDIRVSFTTSYSEAITMPAMWKQAESATT